MIHVLFTLLLSPLLRLLAGRGDPSAPHRILVIQLAKIGDMLSTTPVFRELRRRHPDVEISVLSHPMNAAMLHLNPNVDHVVEGNSGDFRGFSGKRRLVRLLRGGRYDTVVCLNASAAYPVCALWARIPVRLGIVPSFHGATYRLAARLWTATVPHDADRLIQSTYLELLGLLDIRGGSVAKDVFATAGAGDKVTAILGSTAGPWLGIGVSSGNKLKELGVAKLVALARLLLEARPALHVALVGAAGEQSQAREILAQLGHDARVLDTTGQLTLTELPALLMRLNAYVGVDSGITHMADAVGIPVVSVAGPCNMAETRPVGPAAIILQKPLPCAPCSNVFRAPYTCRTGTHACTQEIHSQEIAAATLRLLGETTGGAAQ